MDTLAFPMVSRLVFAVFALAGLVPCLNLIRYGRFVTNGVLPPAASILLVLLFPIGLGLSIILSEEIEVSDEKLTSHFLWRKKSVEASSLRLQKRDTNGFTIVDANGGRLRIHFRMQNLDRLFDQHPHLLKELKK